MHEGEYRSFQSELCCLFDAELEAYLEGEDRPELVAHVRQCAFCQSILADVEQIRSLSAGLWLEDPPANVWLNIRASLLEEGIIRESRSFWQRLFPSWRLMQHPVPVAALAALVILGAVLLRNPAGLNRPEIASAPSRSENANRETLAQRAQEVNLTRTLNEMEKTYQARASSFDPSVKDTYQKSLDSLDREIRECQNSAQREPDDPSAREYLVAAYAQKAQVLQAALEFDGR